MVKLWDLPVRIVKGSIKIKPYYVTELCLGIIELFLKEFGLEVHDEPGLHHE